MALTYTGSETFKYGLDVQGRFPLDSRLVVTNASDLNNYKQLFVIDNVATWYVGMEVFAEDTKKKYVLVSEDEGFKPVEGAATFLLEFNENDTLEISKELFQKMLSADTIKVLYYDDIHTITTVEYNKYSNDWTFRGGSITEGVENSIILNTDAYVSNLDNIGIRLTRYNTNFYSIVSDEIELLTLPKVYLSWNQEDTTLELNWNPDLNLNYDCLIVLHSTNEDGENSHILYPNKKGFYYDLDSGILIYHIEWLGDFDNNNQIKAYTHFTEIDEEKELYIQIVPKTQGSSSPELSGIPIIEYIANNSTCIVSPDTKTYITCEGNANIELEKVKDDGYAHSFLIVLLTVDAPYTVAFPEYVEWLKPLVIEIYTKYFIIIEDNVAMYTSIKVLED